MADYEIIEADFQQYYNLDVSELPFQRCARLLVNLPASSRFVQKYSPFRDWDWDKEVQSRILQMLDLISCHLVNMHRKKGTKALKVSDQFEPDYVSKAKKELKKQKKEQMADSNARLAELFEKRNNQVEKEQNDK